MFLSYPNNTYNQIKSFVSPQKKRGSVCQKSSSVRAEMRQHESSQPRKIPTSTPIGAGRRPRGSGRKPAGERPLDAMIVVRMTDKQKAFFKMAGGSAWLRRVLEVCMERKQFNMASDRDPNEKELLGGLEIDDILPESLSSKSTGF